MSPSNFSKGDANYRGPILFNPGLPVLPYTFGPSITQRLPTIFPTLIWSKLGLLLISMSTESSLLRILVVSGTVSKPQAVFLNDFTYGRVVVAGRAILPSVIEGMERIANNSDPLKFVYEAISYKPFLSLFNMTGVAETNPQLAAVGK